MAQFGVEHTLVGPADLDALERAIKPNTKLVISEAPTNPYLTVVDLARLSSICKPKRIRTLVDSTFATPVNLSPGDFEPWVSSQEAEAKGMTRHQFADEQASTWEKGLADWGQSGERIKRLREAADFAIYTPGSAAGAPISVLRAFTAPPEAIRNDGDLFRERLQTTASSVLALLGIDADPITSREHILVSNLLQRAWVSGKDLDLPGLIGQIQNPPFEKIGVMEVDQVFPAKERTALAMQINNLLAAPGFEAWMSGVPLDSSKLLYTDSGKPRVSVISIAHLGDAERMFFVSMLLNDLIGWMRQQPGTGSLRAVLYMDEIFGYLPPVANPPTKALFLTLLKQARAYGLGVVLALLDPFGEAAFMLVALVPHFVSSCGAPAGHPVDGTSLQAHYGPQRPVRDCDNRSASLWH